jgi:hypothetical protein
MNLDQVDVVNDPNLTGKPMEEITECCEFQATLVVVLPEYLVSISSVSHRVAKTLRTHVGSVFQHRAANVSGSLRFGGTTQEI